MRGYWFIGQRHSIEWRHGFVLGLMPSLVRGGSRKRGMAVEGE